MKNLAIIVCLIFCVSVYAQTTWKVDPAHSNINFSVSHLMISEITGNFGEFDITAVTSDDSFATPIFDVKISTKSINTGVERRDDHLRSDDFFAAETHPEMTFKTTSNEKIGEKTFRINGELTLHGITKTVSLDGKLNGIITDRRSQKLKAGLKITGSINRKDFEVGMKDFPIGEEVNIVINMEMAQQ
ncbi:YceI family protein [Muriicola sp. Z0-33]|uniref:YceI family protein n=1 Tax=Muriicola sp. Z0-33 TaxID=2816957 RepID=UPI002237B9A0|nr:YceI family protein [Muriicola sp. Z0-33]MCW5517027.1 YceI family protein [Muriicola sp. Z0-33]